MGYAEEYRRRRQPWRRAVKMLAYAVVFGGLLYFSVSLLNAQSGLMIGGTIPGAYEQK